MFSYYHFSEKQPWKKLFNFKKVKYLLCFDKNGTAVPGADFNVKKIKSLITFSIVVFQKNGNIKRDSA